jgi:hypothetical protein
MWKQLASSRSILRSEPGRSPILALKLAGGARRSHATAPPSALDSLGSSSHLNRRWTKEQVKDVYESPLMELVFRAVSLDPVLISYPNQKKKKILTLCVGTRLPLIEPTMIQARSNFAPCSTSSQSFSFLIQSETPRSSYLFYALLSLRTGGCTEDCSYCAQSSRYSTGLQASKLIDIEPVLAFVLR